MELLQTLDEVCVEIKRLISAESISSVFSLLMDAVEFTKHIKIFIDDVEGEGTQATILLDDLTATLLTAADEINKDTLPETDFTKTLSKKITLVRNMVYSELKPDKIEVAFFPYKVSMADSLESIYIAARSDPRCEAYWIPIPYYECNVDHSLGQMRYEGFDYPDSLQAIDWQKYDIETHRPDIIFAHAPYDENNYVTCVHPDYHFKRLKDLTDMLVYVPYFVAVGDVSEHLCVLPGTIYADKVVVQSEKVKQTYVRVFNDWVKKSDIKRTHPLWAKTSKTSEKFVPLGSPKIDKILNTKADDFPLPEGWKKLLDRINKEKKKVILFNNGFTNLSEGIEKKLAKLRHVLEYFKSNERVLLWWRPHPLNMACLQSMRPQYLNEYQQIVENYQNDGWGIYDETEDLHRAIKLSDAFYGDWSSLIALYLATGKPVMIQDSRIEDALLDHAFFPCLYMEKGNLWFTPDNFNALFKMDEEIWEPEYIGSFPGERGSNLYQIPAQSNGYLFFPPLHAEEIGVYSTTTGGFTKIPFYRSQDEVRVPAFCQAVAYEKYIYFLPHMYQAILRLNTETQEITYYADWLKRLPQITSSEEEAFWGYPLMKDADTLLLPYCGANVVLEFSMKSQESKIHRIGPSHCQYCSICYDGNDYWLVPQKHSSVIKWNFKTNVTKEYRLLSANTSEVTASYVPAFYYDGYIWLLGFNANDSKKIDVSTGKASDAEEFYMKNDNEENAAPSYYFSQIRGSHVYAYAYKSTSLIRYDLKTKNRREEAIRYSPDIMARIKPQLTSCLHKSFDLCRTENDCCYYESSFAPLSTYIENVTGNTADSEMLALSVKQIEIINSVINNADGSAGEAILTHFIENANITTKTNENGL